ncbi:MAG: hypothetical protein D6690_08030 [Nitrospirae bacterium]|nr:MAG: hypothetical protein D6690_08030 [Nitrospirota bacterium]
MAWIRLEIILSEKIRDGHRAGIMMDQSTWDRYRDRTRPIVFESIVQCTTLRGCEPMDQISHGMLKDIEVPVDRCAPGERIHHHMPIDANDGWERQRFGIGDQPAQSTIVIRAVRQQEIFIARMESNQRITGHESGLQLPPTVMGEDPNEKPFEQIRVVQPPFIFGRD